LQDGETKFVFNKAEITREDFDQLSTEEMKKVEILTFHQFEQLPTTEKKKLNIKFSNPAKKQLDIDQKALTCLLKMIGLKDLPPIKRMIASPEELTDKEGLKKKLSDEGIDFFCANVTALKENSRLIEYVPSPDKKFLFQKEDYKRLISVLAFLSSFKRITKKMKGLIESEVKVATQEAEVWRQKVSGSFRKQSHLEDVVLPHSKTERETVLVWLDPIQREIMNDKTAKKQVIIGPASTGKTILIQLKVLEIIETTDEKILIILPYKQLEEKYKEFFDQNDTDTCGKVLFVTPDNKDWEGLLEENKKSHWFIDEFAAIHAGHKELCNQIITRSK